MKPNKKLLLTLMGASLLSACADDTPDTKVTAFKTLDECKSHPSFTAEQCDAEYKKAQEQAAKDFKFDSKAVCEQQYGVGNCSQPQTTVVNNNGGNNGTSPWIPAMAGFMVGQALSSGNNYSNYEEERYWRERRQRERETGTSSGSALPVKPMASTSTTTKPLYRKPGTDVLSTSNGTAIARTTTTGVTKTVSAQTLSSKPAVQASRGGFATSGRSGFGG